MNKVSPLMEYDRVAGSKFGKGAIRRTNTDAKTQRHGKPRE
jgi:hypothetical protein